MMTNTEDLKALEWFKDHFNSKAKTIAHKIIKRVPLTGANDLKTRDEYIEKYTNQYIRHLPDLYYEIIDNLILDHLNSYFKENDF